MALLNSIGLPVLLNGLQFALDALTQQTADGDEQELPAQQVAEWGIYFNGNKLIEPDSIIAIDYLREWSLPTHPMEQGAFQTYNKVARPFDIRLRLTKGGSLADRTAFSESMENISASLNLYDVVTPEATYLSVNITRLGLARSATNGVTLLTFEIGLQQTRITATATPIALGAPLTNVQQPAAASPVSGGTVQTAAVPSVTQAEVKALLEQQSTVFSDTVGPL